MRPPTTRLRDNRLPRTGRRSTPHAAASARGPVVCGLVVSGLPPCRPVVHSLSSAAPVVLIEKTIVAATLTETAPGSQATFSARVHLEGNSLTTENTQNHSGTESCGKQHWGAIPQ